MKKDIKLIIILILFIIVGLKLVPLAYHTVRCGNLPIVGTEFAASYTYETKETSFYWLQFLSPEPFSYFIVFTNDYYCTEDEAKADGKRPSMFVPDPVAEKDRKVYKAAIENKDPSYCTEASNQGHYCYSRYAREITEPEACEKLPTNYINMCYSLVASKRDDITICNYITDPDYQSQYCINKFLKQDDAVKKCDKLENENTRMNCYFKVADLLKDKTICENIRKSSDLYRDCVTLLRYYKPIKKDSANDTLFKLDGLTGESY